jgi:hypothetical protein
MTFNGSSEDEQLALLEEHIDLVNAHFKEAIMKIEAMQCFILGRHTLMMQVVPCEPIIFFEKSYASWH